MKYLIDFSIFQSPTKAYGNVTGSIELPSHLKIGDEMELLDGAKHKIISLTVVPGVSEVSVLGLEDVVLNSTLHAKTLAARMEAELNMFCIAYEET